MYFERSQPPPLHHRGGGGVGSPLNDERFSRAVPDSGSRMEHRGEDHSYTSFQTETTRLQTLRPVQQQQQQQPQEQTQEGFSPLFGLDLSIAAAAAGGTDWTFPVLHRMQQPQQQRQDHVSIQENSPGHGLVQPILFGGPQLLPPLDERPVMNTSGPGPEALSTPPEDADGIDDVLRLQPWLQE